jgi:hypothetical protein
VDSEFTIGWCTQPANSPADSTEHQWGPSRRGRCGGGESEGAESEGAESEGWYGHLNYPWALVLKTIYARMIYTALCVNYA